MSTTYINSPNGTGTDPQIATFSMWFKITKPEATAVYLFSGGDGESNNSWLRFQTSGQLYFRNRTSSSNDCVIQTNANYRDVNGWYHVVLKLNSTLGTAEDRAIIYVNGQEITSFSSSTNMTQNNLFHMFGSTTTHIGKRVNDGSTGYLGGYLASHVHFCDGYAYDASYFGSTDSTTGEWKINTSPNVTYGTRGFFILKDGNSLTDQSPNTNNFTVGGGTLTNTEDCPSDVFATINPLQVGTSNLTFSHGNTKVTRSGNWKAHMSSIGVNKGKYYWECKCTGNIALGIAKFGGDIDSWSYLADTQSYLANMNDVWILYNNGSTQQKYTAATNGGSWGSPTGDGEIVMIAFDATNGTIWTGNNGTWDNSATESEIENGTTTNAMYSGITIGTDLFGTIGSVENGNLEYNFGNGYFGTTAISSAGTNASNIGLFEYDVPTGFTALSTKGLNE